ncbi:MAG: glutathione-dependent formaldehyde-activating [Proteobacteria bacterium]|nr:glutathione-dependent formaldehyde-activating [Pseudomonadota bacterium]
MNRIDTTVTGGCQCGALRYRATAMLDNSHLCHCRMCQKAAGNIFAALVAAPDDALTWTRGKPSIWKSSELVERGFCANCGTPLFFHHVENGRTNLMIGTLDDPDAFPPHENNSTESMVAWFDTITEIENTGPTESNGAAWAAAIKASNNQHPDHDTTTWQVKGREE